jgi:hypothetical protein
VIGLIGGYAGVQAMDRVATAVYERSSEADKEQEKRVSPSLAYEVAARDLARRAGITLSDAEISSAAQAFHIGLGLQEGLLYVALRRSTGLGVVSAALLSGLGVFLVVDEALTPAMGWSAPFSAYPRSTHLRGLIAHIVLGLVTAITAEIIIRLFRGLWKE